MSNFDIIKNPILIGIVVCGISFMYEKMKLDKKLKKNPKYKNKYRTNIILPVVLGIISGLIAWKIFDKSQKLPHVSLPTGNILTEQKIGSPVLHGGNANANTNANANSNILESSDHNTVLVGKGITNPSTLPDVFLDMDVFE